jgi:SAM-dependent methyltransferase
MNNSGQKLYKRDFWAQENLNYSKPHFRLEKAARLVNRLAGAKDCDLLDVGCGPATLLHLLKPNIHYYGIDIAIQHPAPNLIQADLVENPIQFGGKRFDIVLAQGFFEYVGTHQDAKLAEIRRILKPGGTFVVSYVNFGHRSKSVYWPYSNVQPMAGFRRSVQRQFTIRRSFPTAHNWRHSEPNRSFLKRSQMNLNVNIPYLSPRLAVEYFFICDV